MITFGSGAFAWVGGAVWVISAVKDARSAFLSVVARVKDTSQFQ